MKRFMKGCGMAAVVMAIAGVALGMTGRTVAGQSTINQVVQDVTGGWVNVEIGDWAGWNSAAELVGKPEIVDRGLALETAEVQEEILAGKADVWTGSSRYCPGIEIRNLDIELRSGELVTEVSEDENIYLEENGIRGFQGYAKGDTLYISSSETDNWEGTVILYVPEEYRFDEVEIKIGAGEVYFYGLRAKEASLEVGAGSMNIEDVQVEQTVSAHVGAGMIGMYEMEAGELDVEVGMGEFYATGTVDGDLDAECAMGNVEIGLAGSEEDYNYHLKGSMGNVQVGDYSSAGFSKEKKIDNDAGRTVDVECSMGNITIYFLD